jgi:hypothetical protein
MGFRSASSLFLTWRLVFPRKKKALSCSRWAGSFINLYPGITLPSFREELSAQILCVRISFTLIKRNHSFFKIPVAIFCSFCLNPSGSTSIINGQGKFPEFFCSSLFPMIEFKDQMMIVCRLKFNGRSPFNEFRIIIRNAWFRNSDPHPCQFL